MVTLDNNTTNAKLIEGVVKKALQLIDRNDFQGALKVSYRILTVDKNNTDAMNNKALVLDELCKPEDTLMWFDKALYQTMSKSNETDIDIIFNKALF